MTQSILVAVDVSESDHDTAVLVEAYSLAKLKATDLVVMTVVPDFGMSLVGSFFEGNYHDKLLAKTRESLAKMLKAAVDETAGKEVKLVVATGTAYEEILKFSKQIECDLIVIGAHKPALRDYLLGPNAARVVRHAKQSVYVVRT